jgi:hypothetical protein
VISLIIHNTYRWNHESKVYLWLALPYTAPQHRNLFKESHHDRNPPLLRQRPRRSAQLLDRTLCRARRLGSGSPGLSVHMLDTILSGCALMALVVRLALFLRPKPLRKAA